MLQEKLKHIRLYFELLNLSGLYNEELLIKIFETKKMPEMHFKYGLLFKRVLKYLLWKIPIEQFFKIWDINWKKKVLATDLILEKVVSYKKDKIYILDEDLYRYYFKRLNVKHSKENIFLYYNKKYIEKIY